MTNELQPLSPEALASVGYQQAPDSSSLSPISPEALAKVGYIKPIQDHAASMLDMAKAGGLGFLGEASDLTGTAVKNVGTLAGSQTLQDLGQGAINNAPVLKDMGNDLSPTSRAVGGVGADVLGAAAIPASGLAGAAIGGAVAGLATSKGQDPEQILADTAMSSALSFAVGSALQIGSKLAASNPKIAGAVNTALKNTKTLLTNTEDYTNSAVSSAVKLAGGDITKATPENVVQGISDLLTNQKDAANSLYAMRDAAADSAGLFVGKSNINDLVANLKTDIATGATPEMKAALRAAQGIAGTEDAGISFAKAEALSSKLKGTAADAAAQGKIQLSRQYGPVIDAIQADIADASKANPDVLQLHDNATSFYRNAVVPLQSLGAKQEIIDNSMQRQFVANLVKNLNVKADPTSGFKALPDNVKMNVLGSWLNIIKENAGANGSLDLGKMSQAIQTAQVKNPELFAQTKSFDQMDSLATVLAAKSELMPKIRAMVNPELIGSGIGGAIGHAVAGVGGAITFGLGGLGVPLGLHLYSAGKMLNNEGAQALLNTMKGVSAYPESFIAKEVGNKIANIYMTHAADFAKKIGPTLAGGAMASASY